MHSRSTADRRAIRKAFDLALEAHKDMRRKSGEPYIYHPIGVARIVAEEMGLDTTSIVCALLHDTVEDTYMTLEDVGNLFGERERNIVDGLTKMSGVFEPGTSAQAENFRKMLLTLSNDVRVILIKIADRLDNMRTLEHMRPDKQQKIASETLFMYAPLAHRLGLYGIKTELEDLALKYKEPEAYHDIEAKLRKTQSVRTRFINAFTLPIRRALDVAGMKYEMRSRTKSIFSIWQKMQKQRVTFEEVYDVFAIRIILDTPYEREKADAWRTYSIVTDYYQPSPDRLRDWISLPKANGYESLHTTVMSPTGKWVEVQIRSRRMDEVAEKGLAAHWRYKNGAPVPDAAAPTAEKRLDNWLNSIREILESGEEDALQFIDEFKLNLYSDEIYVFTPHWGPVHAAEGGDDAGLRVSRAHPRRDAVHRGEGEPPAGAAVACAGERGPGRGHYLAETKSEGGLAGLRGDGKRPLENPACPARIGAQHRRRRKRAAAEMDAPRRHRLHRREHRAAHETAQTRQPARALLPHRDRPHRPRPAAAVPGGQRPARVGAD